MLDVREEVTLRLALPSLTDGPDVETIAGSDVGPGVGVWSNVLDPSGTAVSGADCDTRGS